MDCKQWDDVDAKSGQTEEGEKESQGWKLVG